MLNLHLLYSCFTLIAIPNLNCLTHLIKQSACKELSLFRDDARKKWPLKGSKHADSLMPQTIGFRCQNLAPLMPDTRHLKPLFI
jgi:hypothetical protein